jgi:hypothetical protein
MVRGRSDTIGKDGRASSFRLRPSDNIVLSSSGTRTVDAPGGRFAHILLALCAKQWSARWSEGEETLNPEAAQILEVFKARELRAGSFIHPADFGDAIVWEAGFVRDEKVRLGLEQLFEEGYLIEHPAALELTAQGDRHLYGGQDVPVEATERWEYHVERMPMSVGVLAGLKEGLDGAGEEGWELVGVVPTNWVSDSTAPPSTNSFVSELMLWFKRPRRL